MLLVLLDWNATQWQQLGCRVTGVAQLARRESVVAQPICPNQK
jgi:hypothetical protein